MNYSVFKQRQTQFNDITKAASITSSDLINNKVNIKSRSSYKSYRDAVTQPQNVNANKVHQEDESSFGSIISDFKTLFSNFNVTKIIFIVKNTMNKIKYCNDNFSKISYLIEGLLEIFD